MINAGNTALHVAVTSALVNVVKALVDAKADKGALNNDYKTPSALAEEGGNTSIQVSCVSCALWCVVSHPSQLLRLFSAVCNNVITRV